PNTFEKKIVLYTNKVLNAVKRISTMASEKQTSKVILKFTKNHIDIIANDPEIGDAKEEIDISYDLDEFEIAFSSEFLLDALKSIDTEKIIASLNNNTSAVLIKEENNDDYTCLIMPIRIS
ncbi:MAG: hypothetical protein KKH98_10860, partial [Spirochaetes bacterium]|nr:hypothetical protein [Spirochaetota bacterium]